MQCRVLPHKTKQGPRMRIRLFLHYSVIEMCIGLPTIQSAVTAVCVICGLMRSLGAQLKQQELH